MSDETIKFETVSISQIDQLKSTDQLSGDEIFLISQPSDGEISSKSILFSNLVRNVSSEMGISSLQQQILELSGKLINPSQIHYLSDLTDNDNPIPTVISAIAENGVGQIVGLSGYTLSGALDDIFKDVTFSRISAINSPWIPLSNIVQVTSIAPAASSMVVSQWLASNILHTLSTGFVMTSDIANECGDSSDKVASQRLASDISSFVKENALPKDRIRTTIGNETSAVASQSLVSELSNQISNNYLNLSDVVSDVGDAENKAASQKMVTDISSYVRDNCIKVGSELVKKSDVVQVPGNSTESVASQKFATTILSAVQQKFPIGERGDVFYTSPNGVPKSQSIMNLGNIFICESDEDIEKSQEYEYQMKDIFQLWTLDATATGGNYFSNTLEYNGGSRPGRQYWWYDAENDALSINVNSTDWSFLKSRDGYTQYDITIHCESTQEDDDIVFFVGAAVKDEAQRLHTVSFTRTPHYSEDTYAWWNDHHWGCFIDPPRGPDNLDFVNQLLISANQEFQDQDLSTDWINTTGMLLRVVRDGNEISATTSLFSNSDQPVLQSSSTLSINFSNGSGINTDYSKTGVSAFTQAGQIGFGLYSQKNTVFYLEECKIPKIIIDTRLPGVSSLYNGIMTEISSDGASEYVGFGRLCKNIATNKTFFSFPDGLVKFSQYTNETI